MSKKLNATYITRGLVFSTLFLGLVNCAPEGGFKALEPKLPEILDVVNQKDTSVTEGYNEIAKNSLAEYKNKGQQAKNETDNTAQKNQTKQILEQNAEQISQLIRGADAVLIENPEMKVSRDLRYSVGAVVAIQLPGQSKIETLIARGHISESQAEKREFVKLDIERKANVDLSNWSVAVQCESFCKQLVVNVEGPEGLIEISKELSNPMASFTFESNIKDPRGLLDLKGSSLNRQNSNLAQTTNSLLSLSVDKADLAALRRLEIQSQLIENRGNIMGSLLLGNSLNLKAIAAANNQSLETFARVEVNSLINLKTQAQPEEFTHIVSSNSLSWFDMILGNEVLLTSVNAEGGQTNNQVEASIVCANACSQVYLVIKLKDEKSSTPILAALKYTVDEKSILGEGRIENLQADSSLGELYKSFEKALETVTGKKAEAKKLDAYESIHKDVHSLEVPSVEAKTKKSAPQYDSIHKDVHSLEAAKTKKTAPKYESIHKDVHTLELKPSVKTSVKDSTKGSAKGSSVNRDLHTTKAETKDQGDKAVSAYEMAH